MKKYIGKIFFAIIILGFLAYLAKQIPEILGSVSETVNDSNFINAKNLDYFGNFSNGVREEYYGR